MGRSVEHLESAGQCASRTDVYSVPDADNHLHGDEARANRRARLYRVNAIVLRRRDLGETDRIVTLLTAERGKLRVVAKGSRRPSSRIAGYLEPFSASRLLIARTRGLDIISQAESIDPFSGI